MNQDPEILAMLEIVKSLEPLDESARGRVISWAIERLGVQGAGPINHHAPQKMAEKDKLGILPNISKQTLQETYQDFVDLFNDIAPDKGPDKVLVSAFWFQEIMENPSFTGQEVHAELKKMNKGVSNITSTLSSLERQKPALVRQSNKSGKSQQARKTYKLTKDGISYVRQLLADEDI